MQSTAQPPRGGGAGRPGACRSPRSSSGGRRRRSSPPSWRAPAPRTARPKGGPRRAPRSRAAWPPAPARLPRGP
eukprot:2629977-Pyramimonas_sp.AAC.1